jgi:hypothetical protein
MTLQLASGDSAVPEDDTIDEQDRRERDPMTHQQGPAFVRREAYGPNREWRRLAHLVEKAKGIRA